MTKRECVIAALRHRATRYCPYHVRFTKAALERLQAATGEPAILERIGNHFAYQRTRRVDEEVEIRPGFFRDDFGVVWNRTADRDTGVVEAYGLTPENIDRYPFPDPWAGGRFDQVAQGCRAHPELFKLATQRFTLFERAWSLRGMENLLVDFASEPAFVDDLLDRIAAFDLAIVDEALKYPIDGYHFGDDWGQQTGLIMGPKLWRRFIKPRLAALFARVKQAGKFVSIHSCGDVREILPDLIEIGLDLFNPFQPEVMDVFQVKEEFGDRLAFWGGISTQKTMPFGTPAEVRAEVGEKIRRLGRDGGYICAPAHDLAADVPAANMLALIETLQEQEARGRAS